MLNLDGLQKVSLVETPDAYAIEATANTIVPECDSFEGLKKRLIMAHGLQFREHPNVAFSFKWPPGPPKDLEPLIRRMYPVAQRPVVGYRLSTLARIAGKVPLD